MSRTRGTASSGIPSENLAEAGVWIARLHRDARGPEMEAGFREWLRASPMNARAFEAATEVWQESANLRRLVPLAHSPRWQLARRPAFALAAVVAAIAVLGVVLSIVMDRGISTNVGEQRTLNLEDGTHIFLNTATRVVVSYDEKVRRIELQQGEALFNVANRANWPFVVEAGGRKVTALGTSFVIRRGPQGVAVTLIEGKVSVVPDSGQGELLLSPGERASFPAEKNSRIDRPDLGKALAWRRGQVVLDDTPLASAVEEMNRYSSLRLAVDRPEAATLLINGLFQAGDSRSFARAVASTYGLEVVVRGDRIVLSGVPSTPVSGVRP